MSGKRFHLGYARAGLLSLLLLASLACAKAQIRPLTILHTNDLHAHLLPDSKQQGGFAQVAAILRRETAGCQACLILNGGDLVQGTPVSTIYRGLPIYELANLLHFDASVLGNHEFDYGWQRIGEFIGAASFPVIAANVADEQGRLLTPQPYVILTAGGNGGIRVAVIGALTTDLPNLTTPDRFGPWRALPVAETVARYAREVREQSDLIVVLGHLTPEEEAAILRQVPEVAAVVSGHPHAGLEVPVEVDGRVAVRVRANGVEVGRLDLAVDLARKTVAHSSWKRIPVNAESASPAEDVALAVGQWESKIREIVDVPIGTARRNFTREELKPLIEQAMAEELGTDLAFWNLGGVRDTLSAGTILARHIWNIMPFDNRLLIGRFKGSQLPSSIASGRSIDPDREYTLAVSDFVAVNQQAEMGASGLQFPQQTGRVDRDVVMDWIRKKKVLEE
jgi:2',3'-cyclic-nucleotide 2'-phosphodiesterase (5'-nucleotidase family)